MKRLLAALIGVSAILLIACIDEEATIGPTDTQTATATAEERATPPTEQATPEPTSDAAVGAYLADLMSWLDEGSVLSAGVVSITSNANPFSASSEAEALTLSIKADAWRDRANAFDAPAEFADVQMYIELAGIAMADALEDFWQGIRSFNVDLIESATAKLNTATGYIANATAALDAVD